MIVGKKKQKSKKMGVYCNFSKYEECVCNFPEDN